MKKLMLSVSIATALTLTGCGGGSDSPATTNNNGSGSNNGTGGSATTQSSKHFSYYFESDYLSADKYAFIKMTDTIQSGILYASSSSLVKVGGYGSEQKYISFFPFLTAQALYRPDASEVPQLGYKRDYVKSFSDTALVTSPYNLGGYRDLEVRIEREKIDLSGLLVDAILFAPYIPKALQQNIKNESVKFPAGSYCYRDYNKIWSTVNLSTENGVVQGNYPNIQAWVDQNKADGYQVTLSTWAGVKWASAKDRVMPDNSWQVLELDGQVYHAALQNAGPDAETRGAALAQAEKELANNPQPVPEYVNILKNSCDSFNQIAADVIDRTILASIAPS